MQKIDTYLKEIRELHKQAIEMFKDVKQNHLANIETNIQYLKSDVVSLKSDIASLKSYVTSLKYDVTSLKSDVTNTDKKIDALLKHAGIDKAGR